MKNQPKSTDNSIRKPKIRKIMLRWILPLLILTMAEVLLLSGVARIPREAIQKHTEESASYFMEKPVFYRVVTQDPASNIDHYADAILLNVLYNYDSQHPFTSSLRASYYYTDTHNENENLQTAVTSNITPTYDYFRYWHGSSVLIRPLLTLFNIQQIYILLAIILFALAVTLIVTLFREGLSACALATILGLVAVSFWYIPMSLEYIWCFLLMFIAGLLVLRLYRKSHTVSSLFFLLIGNITAYFDFLTTETLTLLFPLALLVVLMQKNKNLSDIKAGFKLLAAKACSWGAGYVSAWLLKWSITSAVLKRNIFSEALSSASARVYGETGELHGAALSISALLRNISCLFPFNFIKNHGYAFAIGCLLLLLMVYYLFRKNDKKNFMPLLFEVLFCIPYIRFLTLANHAFLHYFFTYRAQFASIFCLCMCFYYGIDTTLMKNKILPKGKAISGYGKRKKKSHVKKNA